HDNQCVLALLHGLWHPFPDRSGQGNTGCRPQQQQQQQGRTLCCRFAAVQQIGQQVVIDGPIPGTAAFIDAPQQIDQQQGRDDSQQPQGSQEMEIAQHF